MTNSGHIQDGCDMKALVLWDRNLGIGRFPFLAVKHCDTPLKSISFEIIKDRVGII